MLGAMIGAWQGFWVAFVGIPAFITTLAGMLLFRGLTFLVLDNKSLSPLNAPYTTLAAGFQNGILGGYGHDVFTLILLALLIVVYGVVTTRTVFGRHVFAIGGNLSAAQLSGVKVKWVNFGVMLNMGVLASVAGIVFSSRSNGAQPAAGTMFELDAIAACFIGGASTTGGVGSVAGAMIGGLIMAVLSNAMQILGYDQSVQQVVKGLVLLLAVAFDVYNKRRAGTR